MGRKVVVLLNREAKSEGGRGRHAERRVWEWRCLGATCGLTLTWEHTVGPNEALPPLAAFTGLGRRTERGMLERR